MWIIFALGASLMRGLTYVIGEQVYRKISVVTSLAITTLVTGVVMLLIAYGGNFLKKDLNTITSSNRLLYLIIAEVVIFIIAELLIAFSITAKSATLAGLIEISYPIFIALFAYLLFKENQLSASTAVGGAFIFIGVFVIYYFNR
jgi:drug/metabolite transporter (DMT)-like permease